MESWSRWTDCQFSSLRIFRTDRSSRAKPLTYTPLFFLGNFLSGYDSRRDRRFRVQFRLGWGGKKSGDLQRFTNVFSGSLETASQIRCQGRQWAISISSLLPLPLLRRGTSNTIWVFFFRTSF